MLSSNAERLTRSEYLDIERPRKQRKISREERYDLIAAIAQSLAQKRYQLVSVTAPTSFEAEKEVNIEHYFNGAL